MKNEDYEEYKNWRSFKIAMKKANKPIPRDWDMFKCFIQDLGLKPNQTDYLDYDISKDTTDKSLYIWRNYLGKPNREFPEYGIWKNMRARCSAPCISEVRKYQDKGITVCDRWNDFQTFYEDMGPRPSSAHSIDRINNDGNYEPDNCRWATDTEQNRNKGNVKVFNYNNIVGTIPEIAEHFSINANSIHKSLQRGNTITETVDRLLKNKV